MTFDCKKCDAVHRTASGSIDHLEVAHGFTGPSRAAAREPDVFAVSPRGLADQFGLPTYGGE